MSEREKYEKAVKDAGFEPFEPISEQWGVYALKDGSYLKIRMNVLKIVRQVDDVGNIGFGINGNPTIGLISSKNLRGVALSRPPTPQEIMAAIVEDDVEFSPIEEKWSTYRLQDGFVISLKLIPIKVSRTSLYDQNGEPIYNINHQLLVKVSIPEELRKKGIQVQQPSRGHPTFIT